MNEWMNEQKQKEEGSWKVEDKDFGRKMEKFVGK